jgi:betaine reductase
VDVLRLDEAVALLKSKNIYCEAAMGCTGPVVMTASEDSRAAERCLADHKFIGEV